MERSRLKEEQEKRLQDERTKFIEKTKNLLIFEPVEDDKPKRSTAPAKVQDTHAEPASVGPLAASWVLCLGLPRARVIMAALWNRADHCIFMLWLVYCRPM